MKLYCSKITWLVAFFVFCLAPVDRAQNVWTWIKGSDINSAKGLYGVQGVPNATNTPGSRFGAINWTDMNGNLWLYGGFGKDTAFASAGALSDLWKFDAQLGQWVWVSGSQIEYQGTNPVYGTMGVASVSNTPGYRSGSATWADTLGNLWLFGGESLDLSGIGGCSKNDIWKYNIATNLWTWVGGSSSCYPLASYGTKGVMAPSNIPGGRTGMVFWKDLNHNLWIFGGFGVINSSTTNTMNDLWKYDVSANQWTWMHGVNTFTPLGTYGTMGVPTATTCPGARMQAMNWCDKNGKFWLFGGGGYDVLSAAGGLSDLWKYDPLTNQWTWMRGSTLRNQAPVYGSQNISAPNNQPGSMLADGCWIDSTGTNLWVGPGFSTNGVNTGLQTNIMWRYNIPTNQWVWTKGANVLADQYGVYGTQGVPAFANIPGGRQSSNWWQGKSGEFWFFGGFGLSNQVWGSIGMLNDLWKFDPCYSTSVTVANTTGSSSQTVCANNPLTLTASSPGNIAWYDINSNIIGTGSLLAIPSLSTNATFIVGDDVSCLPISITVTVSPTPTLAMNATNTLICNGTSATLTAVSGAAFYAWSNGGSNLTTTVAPNVTTTYTVLVTNYPSACTNTGAITVSVSPLPTLTLASTSTAVCQGGSATLTALSGPASYSWSTGSNTASVQVTPIATSAYSVVITDISSGCKNIGQTTVTVLPLPGLSITPLTTTVCQGGSTILTALAGAASYSWSNGVITYSNAVAPVITSGYTITVTDAVTACTNSGVATVSVEANPTVTVVASNTAVCQGSAIILTAASGADAYLWSTGSSAYSISVLPPATMVYSVTVTDTLTGCTASSSQSVVVNVPPTLSVASSNSVICTGQAAILTVTGATSYTWSTGANGNAITVMPSATTLYTVTGMDGNGCSNVFAFTQSVSVCTAQMELLDEQTSLLVYPNPFDQKLFVVAAARQTIEVYNALGACVWKTTKSLEEQGIDLGNEPAGVYFVKVGCQIKKVIRQ